MAIRKSQLYSSLWRSCDELRGGMDASQYKDYVLTLLFMKYVSDKYAGKVDAPIEVPAGGGFADMVALKGDKEIGDKINKIIARLAEPNDLMGVITQADFNDENKLGRGKEMQDRLSRLVAIFDDLDLRANRAEGDDLLGDAYEYLMRHFATESGKSKGQFYTPAEVSRVMAKVVGVGPGTRPDQTIYDPTCGSGSLLLKAMDETPRGASLYGQENDNATWALAKMNMFMHNAGSAELWRGNTLATPHFTNRDGSLRTFDFAVANPPFSAKAWSSGFSPSSDEFDRFRYGVPPEKNGDYAFLLHIVASLKSTGKAAVILPHGVLFRGNKEADIRRELVRRGLIKGIIGLPANLFYGTGIPACIVVIDKEGAATRTGIFIVDASRGFAKDGNKNRLRAQDIHKIVDVFTRQLQVPRYARLVPTEEIASAANGFNLNIPRYIDSSAPEDLHDLDAHLNGGIPERDLDGLDRYWSVFPSLRSELFGSGDRPGYSRAKVATAEVKATVLAHPEFGAFADEARGIVDAWAAAHRPRLRGLTQGTTPRETIDALAEDLLARLADLPLLDRYDAYQKLMDYWTETMQDDVYLIAAEGWREAARPRSVIVDTERKITETPDLVVNKKRYKMDLLPPALIVARFFAADRAAIDALEAERKAAAQALVEYVEEHGGDEGLLADALTDKGTVTRDSVSARLKATRNEPESGEERAALTRCLALLDAENELSKRVKGAMANLDAATLAKYGQLSEDEIVTLAVEDKWLHAIRAALEGEVGRLTGGLVNRVKQLEERYDRPLPALEADVRELSARVDAHIEYVQQLLTDRARLPEFAEEWRTCRLDDIGQFSKGSGIKRDDVTDEGLGCIRYGEIYTRYNDYVLTPFSRISPSVASGASQLTTGDLLFAGSGETAEEIGKCVAYLGEKRAYAGGDIVVLTPNGHDSMYLGHLMNHESVAQQKARFAQGDAVVHISARNLAQIEVSLPPLEEQRCIARILADIDSEIVTLHRLQEKTEAIKRGMMQALLTGRVRLR